MGTPSAAFGDGLLPSGVRPLRADDPAKVGGSTLVGRLGSGGMGVVYLGRDPLEGLVAIKYAHASDDESVRRFAAEAEVLRRLPEGCTARLVRDGTAHARPYIISEYVEGRSLAYVVDTGGPLPPEQVIALAAGVLRALEIVHRAGLVHRDLKPPNILLTVSGPRLIDFGIAQEVGASGGPTGPETVVGSPGWIPPERLRREAATPASDVFGWASLVAYAASGRNPHGQGDAEDVARRILTEPPDLDGVEEPLRALVAEALAKDPAERPSVADLLARLCGGTVRRGPIATPDSDPGSGSPERSASHRGSHRRRRRRWPVLAIGGAIAATALTTLALTKGNGHDAAGTPPPAAPSPSPTGGRVPVAPARRVPAERPRSGRPFTRPSHAPSRRTSSRPSASQSPRIVPTLLGPLPTVLRSQTEGSPQPTR